MIQFAAVAFLHKILLFFLMIAVFGIALTIALLYFLWKIMVWVYEKLFKKEEKPEVEEDVKSEEDSQGKE